MLNVPKFSFNCSFFDAPKIMVLTLGFLGNSLKLAESMKSQGVLQWAAILSLSQFSEWFHPTQTAPSAIHSPSHKLVN